MKNKLVKVLLSIMTLNFLLSIGIAHTGDNYDEPNEMPQWKRHMSLDGIVMMIFPTRNKLDMIKSFLESENIKYEIGEIEDNTYLKNSPCPFH